MLDETRLILDGLKTSKRVPIDLDDIQVEEVRRELLLDGKYCMYNNSKSEMVYLGDYYYMIMLDKESNEWYQYFEGLYGDALHECFLCDDPFEKAEEKDVHSFEDLLDKDLWSVPADQLKIVSGYEYASVNSTDRDEVPYDYDTNFFKKFMEPVGNIIEPVERPKKDRPKKNKKFGKNKTKKRK